MLRHRNLIDFLEMFKLRINRSGMCYGIACMAIQAHLSGNMKTFIYRLMLLSRFTKEEFIKKLNAAQEVQQTYYARAKKNIIEKWRTEYKLSEEQNIEAFLSESQKQEFTKELSAAESAIDLDFSDEIKLLLSVPAFFEGIYLYYFGIADFPELVDPHPEFEKIIKIKQDPYADMKVDINTLLKEMNTDVLALVEEEEMLTAYWLANGALKHCSVVKASVPSDIEDALNQLKEGTISLDLNLLKRVRSHFFNKEPQQALRQQNFLAALPLLSPSSLSRVQKMADFNGMYNEIDDKELSTYFRLLDRYFTFFKINQPISFLLGSGGHAITVNWDPHQGWSLVNANKFNALGASFDAKNIAERVLKSFSTNGISTFRTQIYASYSPLLEKCLTALQQDEEWQKIHTITPKKATQKDSSNYSWLTVAALSKDAKTIQQLLEVKADINHAGKYGITPLIRAASNGDGEIVKLLLDNKADVNKGAGGVTALYPAAQYGFTEVVKLLLETKKITDVYVPMEASIEILQSEALEKKQISALNDLLKRKNVLKKEESHWLPRLFDFSHSKETLRKFTTVHAAAFYGHVEVLKELIKAGANPLITTEDNINALELAEVMRHKEVIEFLKPYFKKPSLTRGPG